MNLQLKGAFIYEYVRKDQKLRKEKGMSQEELANEIGVSRQAVSKWESEQSVPDIDKIIFMSEYFDVTTDYILKGVEPVSVMRKEVMSSFCLVFSIIGACLAGIWAFTANRFRQDECLIIMLAGAVVGYGTGFLFQTAISIWKT